MRGDPNCATASQPLALEATMQKWQCSTALWILVVAAGCAGMMKELGAGKKRDGWREVDQAIQAQDEAQLKTLCDDESLGPNNNTSPRYKACREYEALQADKDTGDCTTVVERFRAAPDPKIGFAIEHSSKWAERLAKCEKFKEVFEEIAHLGEGGDKSPGVQVLLKLEQNGVPLMAAFDTYAKENGGAAFLNIKAASYAGSHVASWLILGGHLDQCPLLAKALTDSPEGVRASMLVYFIEAKCKPQGVALAQSLLTAKEDYHRATGCRTLGEIGDSSVVKKLKILAESDSTFVVQEQQGNDGRVHAVKVFPVRDACKEAVGKIQLRAK